MDKTQDMIPQGPDNRRERKIKENGHRQTPYHLLGYAPLIKIVKNILSVP